MQNNEILKKIRSLFSSYSFDKLISLIEEVINNFTRSIVGNTNIWVKWILILIQVCMENLVRFLKFIRFILKNIKKLFKNILRFLKNYLGIIFEEISIYWKFANNFRKSIEDELDKIIEYKKKNIEHLQQQLIEETEETPISFSEPINVPNMFWISLLCLLYFVFSLRMTIWLIEFFYWLPFVHQKIRKYLLPFFYQKTHQYWLPFVHPNIREFIVEWYKSQNKKELRTNKTSNTSRPKRTKPVDISHPVNSFSDYKSSSQKRRSPYRSNNEASSDYDDAQTTNNNLIQPIQPVNNEISEKAGNLDPDINIINSNELLSERPSFNDEILNSNYDDTWINNNDLTQPIQIVDN